MLSTLSAAVSAAPWELIARIALAVLDVVVG